MVDISRVSRRRTDRVESVSQRLPSPQNPKRPACVLDDEELRALELLAAEVRLSVSSLLRVIVVYVTDHPECAGELKQIADRIRRAAPADKSRPGRPKDKSDADKKKPKK